MIVAICPRCGHELGEEDLASGQQQMILAAGSLIATLALVGMMMEHPTYSSAAPGFEQRLREVTEWLRVQAEEIGSWGEGLDGEET